MAAHGSDIGMSEKGIRNDILFNVNNCINDGSGVMFWQWEIKMPDRHPTGNVKKMTVDAPKNPVKKSECKGKSVLLTKPKGWLIKVG